MKLLFYVVFLIILIFLVLTTHGRYENYLNVMEAQEVYNNYRSYIDKNYKISNHNRFLRKRPPMISPNCLLDKMSKCEKRALEMCSVPIIN